jgi:HEAT repeat protein
MKSILEETRVQGSAELLRAIEDGLEDSDDEVRALAAAAGAQMLQQGDSGRLKPGLDVVLDQDGNRFADLLRDRLGDADNGVRGAAIGATVSFLAARPDGELGRALVQAYARESDWHLRNRLVGGITAASILTDTARSVLLAALNDTSEFVRTTAAFAAAKFHPQEAFGAVVAELESGNPNTRVPFALALASYGVAAKPYVNLLERLADEDWPPNAKAALKSAVETIRNAK